MADTNFYKYLMAAFRYKRTHHNAPSFEYLGYKLPYETSGRERGIFYYARNGRTALPRIYTNFPDTKEGNLQMVVKVLDNLDRHLDQQLDQYFNRPTAAESSTPTNIEPSTEEMMAASSAPATSSVSAGGLPPAPAPSFRSPRIIPQVTKEAATGKTEVPKAFEDAFKDEPAYKTDPTIQPSEQANEPVNRTGSRVNMPNIKMPSSVSNLGSNTGIFFQRNVGKNLTGDRLLGFLGRAGNTGIGALSGMANFGNSPGGFFSSLGRFGKGGGGRGFFGRAGIKGSRAGSLVSKAKSKWKLALLGLLLPMMLVGMIAIPSSSSTIPTGTTSPGNNSAGLDYTLPLKDPSVAPADIKDQVRLAFPAAKLEYWDKIIQSSQNAGFNPALALALWIEETGASHCTKGGNGGGDVKCSKDEDGDWVSSKGHLGCAPWEDQTIDESLTCLIKFAASYTNDQFAQFMATYSGGPAGSPFSNNPNFPGNIKAWYQRLVPSGNGAITPVSGSVAPPPDGNYQKAVEGFGIEMKSGFETDEYKWAFEILNKASGMFPKFKDKIHQACPAITLQPTTGISHASSCDIPLSTGTGEQFFKFLVIHELAHKINTTSWQFNSSIIAARVADASQDTKGGNGFLTYYSENAARADDKICGSGDNDGNRADEEFADSVAYYINDQTPELNMHVANDAKGACGVKWNGENPFKGGTRFTTHYNFITTVLQ